MAKGERAVRTAEHAAARLRWRLTALGGAVLVAAGAAGVVGTTPASAAPAARTADAAPTVTVTNPSADGSAGAQTTASAAVASGVALAADVPFDPTAPPGINPDGYQACVNAFASALFLAPPAPTAAPVAGWADAAKLGGAAVVGWPDTGYASPIGSDEGHQQTTAANVKDPTGNTETYRCDKVTDQLDYQGLRELPPFRATFASFGFAPVTATVTLQQAGPLNRADCLESDGATSPDCPPVTEIVSTKLGGTSTFGRTNDAWAVSAVQLTMRLSDVTVNGTPLDVGDGCRSDGELTSPGNPINPSQVVMFGSNIPGVGPAPDFTNVLLGPNALAGTVTIPPFTGCGAGGDNLDPLLTASVSGSGNQAKIIQGAVSACPPGPGAACNAPDWTVTGGGTFTTAAPFQIGLRSGSTNFTPITCPNAEVTVKLPSHQGPLRGDLGTFALSGMDACSGANGSTWSIREQAPMSIDPGLPGPPVAGPVNDIQLELQGSGPGTGVAAGGSPCTVIVTGDSNFSYTNPTADGDGQLNLLGGVTAGSAAGFGDKVAVRTSTCPGIPLGLSTLAGTVQMAQLNLGKLTITNPINPS